MGGGQDKSARRQTHLFGGIMTLVMDRFFIKIGFDPDEVQNSSGRGLLYIGITYMAGMATAFLVMAALS